jgi:hypothetical protein
MHTVKLKRPYFDTLFSEISVFSKICFGNPPPLKIFGGSSKFGMHISYIKVQFTILTVQGP